MSDAPSSHSRPLGCILAVIGGAASIVLTYVLVTAGNSGKRAISAYLGTIRAGAAVTPEVGGDEHEALTTLLRTSSFEEVDNFQSQASTACFWTSMTVPGGHVEVAFLLDTPDERTTVRQVSARRRCECPDPDTSAPCFLHP